MSAGLPRFSVIIAVYNGAATLACAIDSVLGQSYPPHELIVVDDGSTDNTAQVVSTYGDRVRYLHQANAGVAAARNAGARAASGEWLAFLDADDWYYPQRLHLHAHWIAQDAALDFLTGNFDYVRPDGAFIRRSMESTEAGRRLLHKAVTEPRVVMTDEDFEAFIAQHFGDTHTLSVPRYTFLELGGYPRGIAVCEDVNFLIRLTARSRRIGVVCTPMAAYCIHENSATRADSLRAQRLTVQALMPLVEKLKNTSASVRRGVRGALRHARLDLAYSLLRHGARGEALRAVLPLLRQPSPQSVRDVLSIARSGKSMHS